ncbi:hypothetical protein, partial [Stutzerimonas stutzeri]|uniref:hypothetical protein n=1 Tax=Stutzerimonas stutzeri TaxID=316 RepID=UPI001F3B117A
GFNSITVLRSAPATASDKTLELYKQNNTISYKFGHPGRTPELELNRLVDEVDILIGNATGSELSNSITFTNGAYSYTVISRINRVADVQTPEHGILVEKNSKYITYTSCIPASVRGNLLDAE